MRRAFLCICTLLFCHLWPLPSYANPLQDYVHAGIAHPHWRQVSQQQVGWGTLTRLVMVSQHWRGHFWTHRLLVVKPKTLSHPEKGFLLVAGDGDGDKYLNTLKTLAERGGTLAAVLMNVPNQPLYDGRREDALIAFTFNQYLRSGDESWPLLFPMVKSVSSAMDVLRSYARQNGLPAAKQFVLSGASKRGWTVWLTAAVDKRVMAIAPMVIDVLNMKSQLQWSEQVYGRQSSKISDYTELNLHRKQDSPAMQKLRSWVDPYSYRHLLTMPKLLLLGTNDPYWTVDSLRHYWDQLPEPKLIYQTPNAGHDLNGGKQAMQTLAAFYEMVVYDEPLPRLTWRFDYLANHRVRLQLNSSQQASGAVLWTAISEDRDFRPDKWQSRTLKLSPHSPILQTQVDRPANGYKGYLLEVELKTPQGHAYKLSTEARVTPDTIPCHCWARHNLQALAPAH